MVKGCSSCGSAEGGKLAHPEGINTEDVAGHVKEVDMTWRVGCPQENIDWGTLSVLSNPVGSQIPS